MIGWIILGIIGGLILLIAILMFRYVTITVDIEQDVTLKVKYLFFKVFEFPLKPKKAKKKKVKKEKPPKKVKAAKKRSAEKTPAETVTVDETAEQTKTQEKVDTPSESASDTVSGAAPEKSKFDMAMVRMLIDSAKPPVKRLFKKVRLTEVYIDIVVGGDDAAKVALSYGRCNMFINGLLCWLDNNLRLSVGEVNIEADFLKPKTDSFAHFKVKARVSTAIGCLLWFFVKTLNYNKPKKTRKKVKQPHKRKDG